MSPIDASMSAIMSAEQQMWLQEQGFVVRGTFIDVEEEKEVFCHRRTRSLPVSSRVAWPDEPLAMRPASPMKQRMPTVISLFDILGDEASASTTATSSDCNSPRSYSDLSTMESEVLQVAVEEQVEKLAKLISEECCYLRIEGHRYLLAEDGEGGRLLSCKKNVSATLCMFVANLPWTKRAKWRHPLLRSAATALEEVNMDAVVVGGNLFVTLPTGCRIQVDFAAAR
jgi:hypothetical protein